MVDKLTQYGKEHKESIVEISKSMVKFDWDCMKKPLHRANFIMLVKKGFKNTLIE